MTYKKVCYDQLMSNLCQQSAKTRTGFSSKTRIASSRHGETLLLRGVSQQLQAAQRSYNEEQTWRRCQVSSFSSKGKKRSQSKAVDKGMRKASQVTLFAKAELHAFTDVSVFLHFETVIPLDNRKFRKLYTFILSILFISRFTELKSPKLSMFENYRLLS